MINIQKKKPERTCEKNYANYISFKPYLRKDFNQRCGYCDDLDFYSGGTRGFHIDHFRPRSIKQFEVLKQTYSNLIYSCSYCNGAKSNKWIDNCGFIDPTEIEYDSHLHRNSNGKIEYKTKQGQYIYENLKLGLKRHELLWCIEKLNEQRDAISLKSKELGEGHENELEHLRSLRDIQDIISKYFGMFRDVI